VSLLGERPVSAAIRALAAIGPDSAPALVKAAGDRHPGIRASALLALASLPMSCKEVTPALKRALEDRDATVWLLAAINLWRRDRELKKVLPILLDTLKDGERELADAAARALAQIGEPARDALPVLLAQWRDRDEGASARGRRILRLMGNLAVDAVLRELADPPRREDAPAQAQEGGILGAEPGRVPDREVLDADAGGNLVVRDAVHDRREDAQQGDAQRVHANAPPYAGREPQLPEPPATPSGRGIARPTADS
jgi:hypothetical protein